MNNLLIKLKHWKRNYEIHQAFKQAKKGKTTGPLNLEQALKHLDKLIDESK